MVFLILESLGSTELLFILVMALVFFGPRKLPQLSRSLGKNLAEFRKASEDFKRTWEKEVNLEEYNLAGDINREYGTVANQADLDSNSIRNNQEAGRSLEPPTIEAITPDRVIARHSAGLDALPSDNTGLEFNRSATDERTDEARPTSKQDWL